MKLRFFATYRDITRCKELDVPAQPDVWALLEHLGGRYGQPIRKMLFSPDGSEIGEEAIILVNGRNVAFLNGKDTKLVESDVISIFPMVAGG